MAVGSGSSQYDGYNKYFLKVVGLRKGESKAEFEVSQKVGGDYKVIGRERQVSGIITDIATRSFVHDGKDIPKLIIYLVDPDASESIRVETGFNQISRSLMNSLANKDLNGVGVLIRLYNEKKEGRPRVHVEIDNERADWAISMDDQQAYIDTMEVFKGGKKSGEETDFTRLNELMFGEVLDSIKACITKEVPAPKGSKASYEPGAYEEPEADEEPETTTRKTKTVYPTAGEVQAEVERQLATARASVLPTTKSPFPRQSEDVAEHKKISYSDGPAKSPPKPSFLAKRKQATDEQPPSAGPDELPF